MPRSKDDGNRSRGDGKGARTRRGFQDTDPGRRPFGAGIGKKRTDRTKHRALSGPPSSPHHPHAPQTCRYSGEQTDELSGLRIIGGLVAPCVRGDNSAPSTPAASLGTSKPNHSSLRIGAVIELALEGSVQAAPG